MKKYSAQIAVTATTSQAGKKKINSVDEKKLLFCDISLKRQSFIQNCFKHLATLGFIGYLPYGPGTFGSLLGLIIFILVKPSFITHFLIIIIGTIIGIYASSIAEQLLKEKDSKKIVIDEFIGFLVAVFLLPQTYGLIIAAFILFRLFDIFKPLMIKRLELTLNKGAGIMADDLLAGIYTNLILQIWIFIFIS